MSSRRKLSPTMEHAILVLAGEVKGSPLEIRRPTQEALRQRFLIRLYPARLTDTGHIVATLLAERNMARDYLQGSEVSP